MSGDSGIALPGGDLAFGVGGQYRKTKFNVNYAENNDISVNPCRDTPINGNTVCTPANGALAFLGTNRDAAFSGDVYAIFGEIQAPIFDALNLQLAARYEDYGGGVGSTFDPKVTARFQATDWLAFRGSYGTTFRGPADQNLSTGSVTSLQVIGTSFKPVDVFGNPGLSPESSTNLSGGVILETGGLSFTADYFSYDIDDAIVGEPLSGIVNTFFPGGATTNCANPTFAALRQRFQFNDGAGVPGAGTCTLANIARVRTNLINGAGIKNTGLDFQATYRMDDMLGGEFAIGGNATYVIKYRTEDQLVEGVIVQPSFDAAGKLNYQTTAYPIPEWKGQAFIEFGRGIFDARLTATYIDSYVDQRLSPFAPRVDLVGLLPGNVQPNGKVIDEYVTADFSLRVKLPDDLTFNFTVLNITDEDPSFARLDYNYDPFTGNPIGRSFKIGVSKAF